MTSEPDSKPGRRPPTIELKATEVETPASGAAKPADEPAARAAAGEVPNQDAAPGRGGSAGGLKSHAISAGIGALAMAAIVAGLWIGGFAPSRESEPPPPTAATVAAPVVAAPQAEADVSARLDKIERAMQERQPEPALAARLAAVEAQSKSLGDLVAALTRRLDDVAATSQSAAKQAAAAQAAAAAAAAAARSASQTSASQTADRSAVQKRDLDALTSRIAALESAVNALVRKCRASGRRRRRPGGAADYRRRGAARRGRTRRAVPGRACRGANRSASTPTRPRRSNRSPQPACRAPPRWRRNSATAHAGPAAGVRHGSRRRPAFSARLEANAATARPHHAGRCARRQRAVGDRSPGSASTPRAPTSPRR